MHALRSVGEMVMLKSNALRKSLLFGLLVAVVVFAVDAGLEYLLLAREVTHSRTLFISDAFAAMIAAGFAGYSFMLQKQREAEVKERLERIVEMNHHVRNALQVISYWSLGEHDRKEVEMVKQAVDRIEWALREVLPHGLHMAFDRRRGPQSEKLMPPSADRRDSTSA